MDAFYASIEQRDRPHLRGRPVAVGGRPEDRGVVAAASYEARRFGVRSAMPSHRAMSLCPDLVFLPAEFGRYRAVSRGLHAILDAFSDVVEPLSLDEAFLDMTADKAGLGTAARAGGAIRRRVREELGLTCSVGVAPLKFVAKIASDYRKPDGMTVVPPDRVLEFIRPMPVGVLWGVGPATADRLVRLGVHTVADLADLPEAVAHQALGRGSGLWRMARGEDPRPVQIDRPLRSRSVERTLVEDLTDLDAILAIVGDQARSVCRAVPAPGRTVNLKLRYADFTTVSRAQTLATPSRDPEVISATARGLVERTEAGARPVRLIGVGLSGFDVDRGPGRQLILPFAG